MASLQLGSSGAAAAAAAAAAKRGLPSFDGLRLSPSALMVSSPLGVCGVGLDKRLNPLKRKPQEEYCFPTTAQTKPQGGEVVAIGEGRTVGKNKVGISVQTGAQVVYSKYAGTELEFNGSKHLILKEDDIVGILETDDVKDLKPLNDRVLIKVAEAEEKTAGGLLLTEAAKEKPSTGTVIAVGPGPLDEEGNRKPLTITPGSTVLYSKYAGNEFKGADGSEYIALRASDVMAVLS
uniref:20 kDa chaperonin, chloroplastic n=1 Tax=Ananas comosus var. bracteatus TaxID=296719 RepID=A0A6V7P973_ANACO|nr:unnamed protein product [Ananas comosus var. bracteatus]